MISQIFIAILGVTAVWLTQQPNEALKKYACIFGIASQPFWFYAAWASQQWGIFFLCFVYSAAWLFGFYNYWLNKNKSELSDEERLIELSACLGLVCNSSIHRAEFLNMANEIFRSLPEEISDKIQLKEAQLAEEK